MQGGNDDLDAAERALKRKRVHDAEVAWTSVGPNLPLPPIPNLGSTQPLDQSHCFCHTELSFHGMEIKGMKPADKGDQFARMEQARRG